MNILFRVGLSIVILPLLMISCLKNPDSPNARLASLPNITGASGEVLVVMDNNLWKSEAGGVLREGLEQEFPALPQPEPLFDLIHITSGAFDDLFRMHRTIIITDVSSVHKKPEITYAESIWAKPQFVVRILSPDVPSMAKLIKENESRIINNIQLYDRRRLANIYKSSKDLGIKKIISKFGIDLAIPRGYNTDIDAEDFVSFSIESPETSQVIFIYRYPYYDTIDFSTGRLIEKRNEFLKKYTKGSRAGSYMTTAAYFPPLAYDIKMNGHDIVELKGLWELNKGYMGGPFISHSTLDSVKKEIITVDAFVYNPGSKKRNLMRQMEAIVYSLEIL